MNPEHEPPCTCMCTPCAEFAGCAACPDCHLGCDACGYPHPEVDLTTGAPARTIEALAARSFSAFLDELGNAYGTPKPTPGGPNGFTAGYLIIDEPFRDWTQPQ